LLSDEVLKALIEGIVYIAPEPVTLDAVVKALEGEERERVKTKLDELVADYERSDHGIQIRQVANGYKFSTKAEHHEILRKYVKSLKAPIRLSKPALETLAVIAYRQPVTVPEIEEVRGVDCGGVLHTLMEKKLVVTSGRKNVVGRPILYRTSKEFLVHFGLKDVGELPSLKEFEELAKRALGSEWAAEETAGVTEPAGAPAEPASDSGDGAGASPEAAVTPIPEPGPEVPQPISEPTAEQHAPLEISSEGAAADDSESPSASSDVNPLALPTECTAESGPAEGPEPSATNETSVDAAETPQEPHPTD